MNHDPNEAYHELSPLAPAFVGIDLAKNTVHVHGIDESGTRCLDRKIKVKGPQEAVVDSAALRGRHEGLRAGSSMGPRDQPDGI